MRRFVNVGFCVCPISFRALFFLLSLAKGFTGLEAQLHIGALNWSVQK